MRQGLRAPGCPLLPVGDRVGTQSPIGCAQIFRNYDYATTFLARLPYSSSNSTGFLGYPLASLAAGVIQNCDTIPNCCPWSFTFNRQAVSRTYWRLGTYAARPYQPNDAFRCGITAYFDTTRQKCILDVNKALPLYAALCQNIFRCGCKCAAAGGGEY